MLVIFFRIPLLMKSVAVIKEELKDDLFMK